MWSEFIGVGFLNCWRLSSLALFLSALWVDALQFPGSLGASGIGPAGPAGLEVAAVEGAEVPVLVFPVYDLLSP